MKFAYLIIAITMYCISTTRPCIAAASWNLLLTSKYYSNVRMVTSQINFSSPRYIPKEVPWVWARIDCGRSCALNDACQAFNIYTNDTSYVCELLPVNLCTNNTPRALVAWPGSFVWDKLADGLRYPCFERVLGLTNDTCRNLRPGCVGTWPSCFNCSTTCSECSARGLDNCITWPDVNSTSSLVPTFSQCNVSKLLTEAGGTTASALQPALTCDQNFCMNFGDGIHPLQPCIPEHCHCSNGMPFPQQCNVGTIFDHINLICNFLYNVPSG